MENQNNVTKTQILMLSKLKCIKTSLFIEK